MVYFGKSLNKSVESLAARAMARAAGWMVGSTMDWDDSGRPEEEGKGETERSSDNGDRSEIGLRPDGVGGGK